jgi:hypothetical protein
VHFDLLLEEGILCRTFRLNKNVFKTLKSQGESIAPHRKHYLNFEGDIGKNKGVVKRIKEGTYYPLDKKKNFSSWHLKLETDSGIFSVKYLAENKILATWNPAISDG